MLPSTLHGQKSFQSRFSSSKGNTNYNSFYNKKNDKILFDGGGPLDYAFAREELLHIFSEKTAECLIIPNPNYPDNQYVFNIPKPDHDTEVTLKHQSETQRMIAHHQTSRQIVENNYGINGGGTHGARARHDLEMDIQRQIYANEGKVDFYEQKYNEKLSHWERRKQKFDSLFEIATNIFHERLGPNPRSISDQHVLKGHFVAAMIALDTFYLMNTLVDCTQLVTLLNNMPYQPPLERFLAKMGVLFKTCELANIPQSEPMKRAQLIQSLQRTTNVFNQAIQYAQSAQQGYDELVRALHRTDTEMRNKAMNHSLHSHGRILGAAHLTMEQPLVFDNYYNEIESEFYGPPAIQQSAVPFEGYGGAGEKASFITAGIGNNSEPNDPRQREIKERMNALREQVCEKCNKRGHSERTCGARCGYCSYPNHTERQCIRREMDQKYGAPLRSRHPSNRQQRQSGNYNPKEHHKGGDKSPVKINQQQTLTNIFKRRQAFNNDLVQQANLTYDDAIVDDDLTDATASLHVNDNDDSAENKLFDDFYNSLYMVEECTDNTETFDFFDHEEVTAQSALTGLKLLQTIRTLLCHSTLKMVS